MGQIHFKLREIHQIGPRTREALIHPDECPGLWHHQIMLAGISQATTGFRFVRPNPRHGQLLVCFSGEGRVWIDGAWKKCRAGTAYLTPPGVPHAYESGPRWEVGWILYAPEATMPPGPAPTLIETDPRPFEYILRGLHHEITTSHEASPLDAWSHLLHRHASRMAAAGHSLRLWRLWQTVQANLATDWTVAQLARIAGLGPENLRRICLRETGQSPLQHVTRLRMQYAASQLTRGRKIAEVAQMVGYTNAFAFSTAFKRMMKASPSRFKE